VGVFIIVSSSTCSNKAFSELFLDNRMTLLLSAMQTDQVIAV